MSDPEKLKAKYMKKFQEQAFQMMNENANKPLATVKAEIRARLAANGTNVKLNDADPLGDGDQSPVNLGHARNQVYRDLYAIGGDMSNHMEAWPKPAMSGFSLLCLQGRHEEVHALLQAQDSNPQGLIRLLETRETSMRLSPLLMMVSMAKNLQPPPGITLQTLESNHREIVKTLLKFGARPDARDVVGKTVVHYGAGGMATPNTLTMVDMCVHAAKSCHLFGKRVELFGLQTASMNGKIGVARGFMADSGRRIVYLEAESSAQGKLLKPENLRLVDAPKEEESTKPPVSLVNVQDRLGLISLLEVIQTDRADVAQHLLQHHPDLDLELEDVDGMSAKKMAINTHATGSAFMGLQTPKLILKQLAQNARQEKSNQAKQCNHCGKIALSAADLSQCAGCQQTRYCSKKCQKLHWKNGHKEECSTMALQKQQQQQQNGNSNDNDGSNGSNNGTKIVMETAPRGDAGFGGGGMHTATISGGMGISAGGSFCKPDNVAVDETFYVKVQGGGDTLPLLVYDRTRQCQFSVGVKDVGFQEMLRSVRAERTYNGRKTFMKASFDAQGRFTVYPNQTSLKKW